ncbi:MAG: PKD domain-containing protein [Candidatus Thermoplasmatota archaeon]|nr:PKD domain-containing protein [Candidatus Thermoplasmatota archaeon]
MVIQPQGKESVDSEISSIALSNDGGFVAWATYNGLFTIMSKENNEKSEIKLDNHGKNIEYISSGNFVVSQDEGNIICFSKNCEKIWEIECPGGSELMKSAVKGDLIAVIDGTNKLRTINSQGELLGIFTENELIGMTINENGSAISGWDDEGNLIVLSRNCSVIFKRPINSEIGERIITAKYTHNGILLVSRETLDLPEEGEQNELEFWNPLGQKTGSVGFNSRCIAININKNSIWVGLFSGEVLLVNSEKTNQIWKSEYSITSLITLNEDILVSSWFYLFRINRISGECVWQYEHEGIIDLMLMSENEEVLAICGNDRNDYTNAAPLTLLDPNSTPIWEEESDDEYIETETIQIESNNIYNDSNEDLKNLLGDDYNQYDLKKESNDSAMEDLMAAFNEESPQETEKVENGDNLSLIEHLLSNDEKRNQPPVCNAGEDQNLEAGDDGSCLVLLDGSSSHDPDGYIRIWNWTSEDGRTLSNGPKIKLRLPIGNHRFTLTVTDDDGAMSSDSVSVIIR